jgi:putative hydrolase of the HAD superfamily
MYLPPAYFLQDFYIQKQSFTSILSPMFIKTMFFDLDDTLYPPSSGIWEAIGIRMEQYMVEKVSIPSCSASSERKRLFHTHGTTLRGLVAEYGIDDLDFLNYVHDIPINDYLSKNEPLRKVLTQYPQRKVIFTNANTGHANNVLNALGIRDLFDQVIDICSIKPWCKPQTEAFTQALELSKIDDPRHCVMIDDALPNLITAHGLGFYTIRVGTGIITDPIDAAILTLEELPTVLSINNLLEEHV